MKKKLLFINGHLNTGGVEKSLLDILTHLDYTKYEVDLLLTEALGDYADHLPPQVNVLLRSIEGTYGPLPRVVLRCMKERDWFSLKLRLIFLSAKLFGQKRIAMTEKMLTDGKLYDCVIGFRPGLCTQLAAFAVRAHRRITWWHHGQINVVPKDYRQAALCCDHVAVVSDACRNMLADKFPELSSRLVTVPNMVDVSAVRLASKGFSPDYEAGMLHIVSVGRLAPEKHFENAIFAARKLKDQGVHFRWHLVGDGILREELNHSVKELDVTDCVLLEGNQVNPYPYMKHADLFVHPSYVESFGIAVTEALALGVPCVVTRSAGVLEFLRDGENALVTEQSPESLAAAVLRLLKNRELYEKIKENTCCPAKFLPERAIETIDSLLEG